VRPAYEVADVLAAYWQGAVSSRRYNAWQLRTLDAIKRCRTASLGGHIDQCTACGHLRISYNSCRNRHCPKCQNVQREKWIMAREEELLPVTYFHVVFTLPEALNEMCLHHPKKSYDLLFHAAWSVMNDFGKDPKHLGAQTGMICTLHTWGQNLSLHPHLHCIVPGGGLTPQGKWKQAKSSGKFLFPVKAISRVFRARFVAGLRKQIPGLPQSLYDTLFKKEWVVYAKQPFLGPKQVVEYLGRYTHKIAISNHRLLNVTHDAVTFTYKDYRDAVRKKQMSLSPHEFIRRFALHILPKGFVRIRHYGILSSTRKVKDLPQVHAQLGSAMKQRQKTDWKLIAQTRLNFNPGVCPCCKKQTMQTVLTFDRRGPPDGWEQMFQLKKPAA